MHTCAWAALSSAARSIAALSAAAAAADSALLLLLLLPLAFVEDAGTTFPPFFSFSITASTVETAFAQRSSLGSISSALLKAAKAFSFSPSLSLATPRL